MKANQSPEPTRPRTGLALSTYAGGRYFVVRFGEHPPGDYAKRYFGLLHDLEDQLESPVDLLTEPSVLKHELGKRIKAERVCVYESGGS